MKIQSKFKDYYDYVGQRYGEDPDVVYARGKIKGAGPFEHDNCRFHWLERMRCDEKAKTLYSIELIVAGEWIFPLVKMDKRFSGENSQIETTHSGLNADQLYWITGHDPKALSKRYAARNARWPKWGSREREWDDFHEALTNFAEKLRGLQEKLGAPVFRVGLVPNADGGSQRGIYEHVPILADYGIPAAVSPEQMWQNIYGCFTNRLRKNPDKEVPVEVSNDTKIAKAGFDLKTSFRHPVNQKKVKKR